MLNQKKKEELLYMINGLNNLNLQIFNENNSNFNFEQRNLILFIFESLKLSIIKIQKMNKSKNISQINSNLKKIKNKKYSINDLIINYYKLINNKEIVLNEFKLSENEFEKILKFKEIKKKRTINLKLKNKIINYMISFYLENNEIPSINDINSYYYNLAISSNINISFDGLNLFLINLLSNNDLIINKNINKKGIFNFKISLKNFLKENLFDLNFKIKKNLIIS